MCGIAQNRRPNIARSRSTPRLSTSGGSKPRIDNTFQCDHQVPPSRALLRHCYSYVKELGQLRNYTQFEANNQKRLMRRQYFAEDENKRSLSYSQGGALYTSRPPTGVDLALGLSGYDKLYNTEATTASREVRTPTTLQAYKDEDEEMKRRVASLDTQEAKWQRIKAEVEEGRENERREHEQIVSQAKKLQFEENCEEAREEVSKQLNRQIAEDWDYQKEFKQKQKKALEEADYVRGVQDIQINQDTLDQVAREEKNKEMKWMHDRRDELHGRNLTKFHQQQVDDLVKRKFTEQKKAEEAKHQQADAKAAENSRIARQMRKESLESHIEMSDTIERTKKDLDQKYDNFKDQENKEILSAHSRDQKEEISNQVSERDAFMRYKNDMEAAKARSEQNAEVIRERTNYQLAHQEQNKIISEEASRKANDLAFRQDVNRQIEAHENDEKQLKAEKSLAQEARLESEKSYRAEQQLAKDRRIREQKAYRDFLFTQMNERKAREDHRSWQEKVFLENRMMGNNQRNDATHKLVDDIVLDDIQKQKKEMPEASAMT